MFHNIPCNTDIYMKARTDIQNHLSVTSKMKKKKTFSEEKPFVTDIVNWHFPSARIAHCRNSSINATGLLMDFHIR